MTVLELSIFQKKFKKIINGSSITKNIYRIQAYSSLMCGYSCIKFIDFMVKGENLTDFASLFSPNSFENMMI